MKNPVYEQIQARKVKARLRVLQHAQRVSGNVTQTCRFFGVSSALYYIWKKRYVKGRRSPNVDTALQRVEDQRGSLRMFATELSRWPSIARWAPLPLRLIVGFGFMQHGFAKLSKGPDSFAAILHALGVPAPHFMTWATILAELSGGLALILGSFVTLVSLPMAALLLVTIFSVHLQYGFSSIRLIGVTNAGAQFGPVGYECSLLYLACLVSLVLGGSGPWAIDGLLRKQRP